MPNKTINTPVTLHTVSNTAPSDAQAFDLYSSHSGIFSVAVEKTQLPIVFTDPNRTDNPIVFVNQAFLRLTGYDAEEIIGKNCRFLQGPDTDPATVAEIRQMVMERRDLLIEVLNYRKNGSTFWNALFISPIFDEAGKLLYFFSSQLDVSRRRDAENALHQSQKMEALGQLTGGIAHDFNNLLQIMMGYLDLMQMGIEGRHRIPDDRMLGNIENVRGAVRKASALTRQLLAFARKQQLEGRTINLNSLAENMTGMAQRSLGEHIELTVSPCDGLWNCKVDPTQMEMALLNVLLNARDAIGQRANGAVVVQTSNVELPGNELTGFADLAPGTYVCISVSDNGAGIAPDIIGRVMDAFFTTKDEGKGTGLGLSMVYGFAKQSGGSINLYSEPGVGTTVRMYFPAVNEEVAGSNEMPHADTARGSEKILIVDDREDVAEVAQAMLEQAGYRTLVTHSAGQALLLLDQHADIDLLFTDLVMPGSMNGIMLAREAQRRHPRIKVLLTTGFADIAMNRSESGQAEFDMLHKPYRQTDLTRHVGALLENMAGME